MTRSLPVPILALALACVSQPAAAQDARSCLNEVGRLSASFPLTEQNSRQEGGGEVAGSDIPVPSANEEEQELARSGGIVSPSRIGEGTGLDRPSGPTGSRTAEGPLAREPGTRRGASIGNEQRQKIRGVMDEARDAGERGDGPGCVERLAQARTMLREAGIGSSQPGGAGGGDTASGTAGGGAAGSQGGGGSSTAGRGGMGAGSSGTGSSATGGGAGMTGSTGGSASGGISGGSMGGSAGGGASGGGSSGGSSGGGSGGGG